MLTFQELGSLIVIMQHKIGCRLVVFQHACTASLMLKGMDILENRATLIHFLAESDEMINRPITLIFVQYQQSVSLAEHKHFK